MCFFGLTKNPFQYQKLVQEIRTTFATPEDIVCGPKLLNHRYLRACIDEGMRFAPSGPCDLPREVLSGGIRIQGEYYPEGTIVGTVPWVMTHDETDIQKILGLTDPSGGLRIHLPVLVKSLLCV